MNAGENQKTARPERAGGDPAGLGDGDHEERGADEFGSEVLALCVDAGTLDFRLRTGCESRMQMRDRLDRVLTETAAEERVLDVGGAYGALNTATHVMDVTPYADRKPPLFSDRPVRFSAATWVESDMCERPWPFADKYFGYSFCRGTLEDVRDPVGVCRELMRVSRAGYIETPSRLREIFCPRRGYWFRRLLGRKYAVGFGHHRWFCYTDGNGVTFLAKTLTAVASRKFFITVSELGRHLTEEESSTFLFWREEFGVRERLLLHPGEMENELARFKVEALRRLKTVSASS